MESVIVLIIRFVYAEYRVFIFGKVIYQYLPNCSVVFEGPFQINGAFAEKNVIAVGAEIPEGHLDCPLH